MVVTLLYEMQSPCNCFTLTLSGSVSRRSNSQRDDNDASVENKVPSGGYGDHDSALEMEIKGTTR